MVLLTFPGKITDMHCTCKRCTHKGMEEEISLLEICQKLGQNKTGENGKVLLYISLTCFFPSTHTQFVNFIKCISGMLLS